MNILGKRNLFASLAVLATLATGCKNDSSGGDGQADVSGEGPLYLVSTSIDTPDGTTALIYTPKELTTSALNAETAIKITGGGVADYYNNNIYIGKSEKFEYQRYEVTESGLLPREVISFANRGLDWLNTTIISESRAFTFSGGLMQYIEWNPTSMTITKVHDLSALKKQGWGWEWRDAIYRKSDGKIFFYFAYTNERTSFINEFSLAIFDTNTDTLKVLHDASCPTSAGFGGYVAENDDFYAFADNFGLFTQVGATEVKQACVLRVKSGEDSFDPSFRFIPSESLEGKAPWGYYYLGDNLAFTSVVDVTKNTHGSVFGLLFAPEHSGALINTLTKETTPLPDLPLSGVGFQPFQVDGSLLVSRTVGTAKDNEGVENSQTVVYRISSKDGEGKAEPLFEIPGIVGTVKRVR